jgi:serine/threonine protein phosphatase PrpC
VSGSVVEHPGEDEAEVSGATLVARAPGATPPPARGCVLGPGEAVALTVACPGELADANEDAYAVIDAGARRAVLAVADGVGGTAGGREASQTATSTLAERVTASTAGEGDLRGAILDAFETASQRIAAPGNGAGTTLVAVEIDGCDVRPYHAGDSAVLVVGQRGKIKLETVAHSPVGYAVEAGLLDGNDAVHHEERHVVSNTVGSPAMRIELGATLTLAPRDTLLLATDGLFDNLYVPEIVETIRKGPLLDAASRLATLAWARMDSEAPDAPSKPDDLTFILYRPRPSKSR